MSVLATGIEPTGSATCYHSPSVCFEIPVDSLQQATSQLWGIGKLTMLLCSHVHWLQQLLLCMIMMCGLRADQASLANRNELLEKFLAMQQQQQQQAEAASIEPGGAARVALNALGVRCHRSLMFGMLSCREGKLVSASSLGSVRGAVHAGRAGHVCLTEFLVCSGIVRCTRTRVLSFLLTVRSEPMRRDKVRPERALRVVAGRPHQAAHGGDDQPAQRAGPHDRVQGRRADPDHAGAGVPSSAAR